ncbi:MAG: YdaU family protein [Proteobacteria bacterium]|nr:YdaU family protein [Pseudomonadota bacterium]
MTDALPPPPVPADCDLRGLPFMPLHIDRLQKSKAWLRCKRTPALAFYLLNLWMRAWQEAPASSLEDDDDVLADAAMCPPSEWATVRDEALRGWTKCSDGRLYNPTVAELARDAWEERVKYRQRTEAARRAREEKRNSNVAENATEAKPPRKSSVTEKAPTVTTSVTALKGEGQGEGQGECKGKGQGEGQGYLEGSVPSERTRAASSPAAPVVISPGNGVSSDSEGDPVLPQPPLALNLPSDDAAAIAMRLCDVSPPGGDWRKALYRQGLDYLARATGKKPDRMRGFLGAQLKALQDDPRAVFDILAEAEQREVAEPVAWITRAVATRAGSSGQQQAVADDKALMERIDKAMTRA